MTDRKPLIKRPYKTATFTLIGLFIVLPTLYCAYLGVGVALDNIAQSRFKDMTLEKSECLARYEQLTEGLVLE